MQTLHEITRLAEQYRHDGIDGPEFVARYILTWQCARFGRSGASRRSRMRAKLDVPEWLSQLDAMTRPERRSRLIDFLEHHELRGIRRRVPDALIGWLNSGWDIRLFDRIPNARDVLAMQANGARPVTVIADYPRLLQPVLEKPDALAFACHDLEHAWLYFHDAADHAAQRRFARTLLEALESGVFAACFSDSVFADKFDYLAADMNTHPMHSALYLRAILVEHYLRGEGKPLNAPLSPESRERLDRCLAHFTEASWHGAPIIPETAVDAVPAASRTPAVHLSSARR